MLSVANLGSCVGLQHKIGHLAHRQTTDAGSHAESSRVITRFQNMLLCIIIVRDIFVVYRVRSVGTYPETSSHATCQKIFGHSRLSPLSHCELILA